MSEAQRIQRIAWTIGGLFIALVPFVSIVIARWKQYEPYDPVWIPTNAMFSLKFIQDVPILSDLSRWWDVLGGALSGYLLISFKQRYPRANPQVIWVHVGLWLLRGFGSILLLEFLLRYSEHPDTQSLALICLYMFSWLVLEALRSILIPPRLLSVELMDRVTHNACSYANVAAFCSAFAIFVGLFPAAIACVILTYVFAHDPIPVSITTNSRKPVR